MSTKEFQLFVVDLSPSMGEKNGGRNVTDLDYGLKMFYDYVTGALLKSRKQDRIGVVLCHSRQTKNSHADAGSLRNIEVYFNNSEFTYDDLRAVRGKLEANEAPVREEEGDCFEAVLVAIGLYKETSRLKYNRKICVITNGQSPVSSFGSDVTKGVAEVIANMEIQITVNGVDFGAGDMDKPTLKWKVEKEWNRLMLMYNGSVKSTSEVNRALLYSPPLKRVRPIAAFSGELRFGVDYNTLSTGGENVGESEDDDFSISINVQSYPAIKQEKLPNGHQYVLNGKTLDTVKNEISYYIVEDESQANNDGDPTANKIYVEKSNLQSQFKYSNIDPPIPLEADLVEACTLHSSAGLDILGFLKRARLPYAYSTGESCYVVPSSSASRRDFFMFNSIAKVLSDMHSIAICRYVPKNDKDIQICSLKPSKFRIEDDLVNGLILERIAFKEDEQVGRFPPLTKSAFTSAEKGKGNEDADKEADTEAGNENIFASEKALSNMMSFILARDLDGKSGNSRSLETIIDIPKVTTEISQNVSIDETKHKTDLLHSSSPALFKFSKNLKKIVEKSLDYKDLHTCLGDESFLETKMNEPDIDSNEYQLGRETTNLFNLNNVLSINTSMNHDYLQEKELSSKQIAKQLIKDLDIKYIKRDQSKRQRKNDDDMSSYDAFGNRKGKYGDLDGVFDKALDTDDLLKLN